MSEDFVPATQEHVSALGVSDETGEPLIVAIGRPVEERERAGAELGRAGPFASIIEESPDAVVALDRSNFITFANPVAEKLLAEEQGALIGEPIALFWPHAGRAASTAVGNGEISDQEMELRLRGGAAPGSRSRCGGCAAPTARSYPCAK